MNLQQLRYVIEVERTGSITQAAENLFMGQPNLSKAIRELEREIGMDIFHRSSRGIDLTEKGRIFLSHAKNVLSQIQLMQDLGKTEDQENLRFSLSAPRCCYIAYACAAWFSSLDEDPQLELRFRETDAAGAANDLLEGRFSLGVLRYPSWQEPYTQLWMQEKGLSSQLIWEFDHVLLLHRDHPLAGERSIDPAQLSEYREILYGDRSSPFGPAMPADASVSELEHLSAEHHRPLLLYDRGSLFQTLAEDRRSFMWISPSPAELLEPLGLVQRPCSHRLPFYRDVLAYDMNRFLSALEKDFLNQLQHSVHLAQAAILR
ncbi:MAG: LysR family transcriptional regulator [Bacillota bacterium]|nr:LysR family transcriptional regulator [Bacillota bacterium]